MDRGNRLEPLPGLEAGQERIDEEDAFNAALRFHLLTDRPGVQPVTPCFCPPFVFDSAKKGPAVRRANARIGAPGVA